MRINFEDVYTFLELNVYQKHEESCEYFESLMLSGVDCIDYQTNNEFSIDYFMIHEQNIQVYFNRIRNFINKIIVCPLRITKFSESCGNLLYSLINLTNKITNLGIDPEFKENDYENAYFYNEILIQLKRSILLIGNWKNYSSTFLDSKCFLKEKSVNESVYTVGFHTILSVQNLFLYLIYYLSQQLFSNKNSSLALNFDLCSISSDNLDSNEDESCLFVQKISDMSDLSDITMVNLYCDCVSKCWYLAFKVMQQFENAGYFNKIQQGTFWSSLNRLLQLMKNFKITDPNKAKIFKSNQTILINESVKIENFSLFTLLLSHKLSQDIKLLSEKNGQIEPSNYLDPSYQLIKTCLKDIIDQNQTPGQASFLKIKIPLELICIEQINNMPKQNFITASQIMSSNPVVYQTNPNLRKILVDILLMLWESYFSKLLNSSFFIQLKNSNSLFALTESQNSLSEFKHGANTVTQICNEKNDQNSNIFHLFLKFLYLNLKDGSTGSTSLTSSNNSNNNNNQVNLVWRQFKGRLYTRLHDKRITELDMSGLLNVSYMFFILIKCFTLPNPSLAISQLKYEQIENYFRILNVFIKSKNMDKIESILGLNNSNVSYSSTVTSAKINAVKSFMNMKFIALKLWFDSSELENSENSDIDNLINIEFSENSNSLIKEAIGLIGLDSNPNMTSNQISNYKNFQVITQFLTDFFVCYLENCRDFLIINTSDSVNLSLYQIAFTISRLLNDLKFQNLMKILSRKQNELIFSRICEILMTYKKLFQNDLANYACNTKLSESMVEYLSKLWSVILDQQSNLNKSTIFSYEIISEICFEICSLYSNLIFNPQSLVHNTTKEMKNLTDMIDQFALSIHQTNIEDHCQSILVRIKFLNLILNDLNLSEICDKNLPNFQAKLINLLIFSFINSTSTPSGSKDIFEQKDSNTSQTERELCQFVNLTQNKINIFNELNLKFSTNIEQYLIDFLSKYALKLKNTQSFNERKIYIDNLNTYFNDFIKLVNSITTISSHSILYKTYIIASQIVYNLSAFLHSRGRSDTLFAKIIDKLVLPIGQAKSTNQNNSKISASNVTHANNQNSILISLKDTLHLFLIGISRLNYEYDGYLQRVLQSIINNFTMKFQMMQVDDHFIVLAIEDSFKDEDNSIEVVQFRSYLLNLLKQLFLNEPKNHNDTERCLQIIQYILNRTQSKEILSKDIEILFGSILSMLSNENQTVRTKSLNLFSFFMDFSKKCSSESMDSFKKCDEIFTRCIENLIKTTWSQQEPNKIFVSLSLIAKQRPSLITHNIKELILEKVEEAQSKFRYNVELKNTLFTLFEYLDGDEGKVYLNKRLGFLWY
ncbi:unnamed protein product [Brachionus calyciflorus]|uniref:MMS22-like C-terminal domain-containing protein n=1 Tax=Brachionus calyciflorus TaxID=104777 RepID=A0A813Y9T8_9BILA|nr:unnamed protein product [Brachionus calyciflorus]